MNYAERREAILEVLCIRRHDTYRNLAFYPFWAQQH